MSKKLQYIGFVLLSVLVCVAPQWSYAAKKKKETDRKYSISCDITGMPVQTVRLEQLRANDSVNVVDSQVSDAAGHFLFTGTIRQPGLFRISFIQDKFIIVSLDEGSAKISANWSLESYKLEGMPPTQELKAFIEVAKPLLMGMNESQKNLEEAKRSGNQENIAKAQKEFDEKRTHFSTYAKHYCDTTRYQPNAILAANIFNVKDELPFMESFNASMQKRFPCTYMTKDYSSFLARLKENLPQSTEIGDKAPELRLMDTSGKQITLSSYKGKYVLLDFWASWCGPCRAENPNVVAAYNKYKGKNFTILSVSLDSKKDAWKGAIEHDMLAWAQVSDLKGWQSVAAGKYSVRSIPTNFLIDPNGTIIAHGLRGPELEKKLEEVLK